MSIIPRSQTAYSSVKHYHRIVVTPPPSKPLALLPPLPSTENPLPNYRTNKPKATQPPRSYHFTFPALNPTAYVCTTHIFIPDLNAHMARCIHEREGTRRKACR